MDLLVRSVSVCSRMTRICANADILAAFDQLEKKAAVHFAKYDFSPSINVISLSEMPKKRIEYRGNGKSLREVAHGLLELNQAEHYISDWGTISIGINDERIKSEGYSGMSKYQFLVLGGIFRLIEHEIALHHCFDESIPQKYRL